MWCGGQSWFLPRPSPEGNGRGQHAAIKVLVQVLVQIQGMTNGPIRAKQVNRSSSVMVDKTQARLAPGSVQL